MDEIKMIVERYLADKDYEKALSLLKNLPNKDGEYSSLMEACEKGFVEDCTARIAHFAQIKDKESAEEVVEKYISLIGQDTNVTLWRALIDNLTITPQTPTVSPATRTSSWENNIREFITDCKIDSEAQRTLQAKWMKGVMAGLIGVTFFLGVIPNFLFKYFMCLSVVSIAVILMIVALKTKGVLPKLAASVLVFVPTLKCILNYLFNESMTVHNNISCFFGDRILEDVLTVYFYSFGFVALYNLLLPKIIGIKKRLICSLLLLTLFNPLFWGLEMTGGVFLLYQKHYSFTIPDSYYYSFDGTHKFFIFIAAIASYLILYRTLIGGKWDIDKIRLLMVRMFNAFKSYMKELLTFVRKNRKPIMIAVSVVALLVIGIFVNSYHNKMMQEEADRQAAITKAYNDSIAAVKQAEKDRLAAIAQAKRDSIAAIEQARQDSIARVEHAKFAKKYSNIGLIITKVKMTRGRDKDDEVTKGIEFTIFNPTKKKIKYVVASMVAINSVGDVMSYQRNCRGIGPVDSYDYGSWSFDEVFYDKNDVIDDLRVYFRVIYTNGTSKTVKVKDAFYSGDFEYSWFE